MNFINKLYWNLRNRLFNVVTGPHVLSRRDYFFYAFGAIDFLILAMIIKLVF